MIIKYLKKKEIEKSGYAFIQIVGEKADGEQYTKDFFANDSDLSSQLDNYVVGEFLTLTYKNDKFKNLKGIAGADGFAATGGGGKKKAAASSGGGSDDDSGNTRGADTNRASAVYLAKEVVFKCLPNTSDEAEVLNAMFVAADAIHTYVTEGRNVIAEAILESGLTVPEIDK